MIILITAVFLVSIAGVCAADANDTMVASDDANQMDLSSNDVIVEDNLQTGEENNTLTQANDDEIISAGSDSQILAEGEGTYYDLINEIGDGGDKNLTKSYYKYTGGDTIKITTSGVINGNGAVIDMARECRAFYVSASGVTIKNLTIKNANVYIYDIGGAIYFSQSGSVINCNFTGNNAGLAGAIYFYADGTVTNCNFAGNSAQSVDESDAGAVYFRGYGTVTNCNFDDNTANYGGAVCFWSGGEVINCNFANNFAYSGNDIYSYGGYTTVDTCIFKTGQDSWGVIIRPPTLNVDDFTTVYNSGEKLTFNLTTNSGMPVDNGNISISVYYKNNDSWVDNYSCLSGEGWTVDLPVGSYYAIFNTEYVGFNAINRTITVIPNIPYYANVTPVTTNNKTVNITAKSNIPQDIIEGKLLFILPNGDEINATYAADGIWWAVHTFDDYIDYQVNASYVGLSNVTINNATISITRANSTVNVSDVVLNYGEAKNVTVTVEGATGITAKIDGVNVTVDGYVIMILVLNAGNHTLAVTTMPDEDHISVTKTVNITVNKVNSTLTVNNIEFNYGGAGSAGVSFNGASGVNAKIMGHDEAIVDVGGNTITVSGLGIGTYNLTVTTIADTNHNPVTKNATVTVNKAKTQLVADEVVTTYNTNKNLVITLKDSAGKPLSGFNITVDLNGTKNYTTDTNGQVKISTMGLAANIYDVMISFNGTDNYLNSSNTTTVSIYKESSRVDTKPLTTDYNVHKYLVVGLKDNEGNPIRNADAFIEIHGVTYKCRSDDAGDARLIIRLNPGTYTAKITFDNVNYTGFTQYVTVIVKKLTPKLAAKKKTFRKAKKVKKYTVTLKANSKALAKVKLTLKVKGKTYKAKTNAKGKAVFKIKNLKKKGKYRATVKFAGNNYYNKVTKKVKITVK